MHNLSQKYFKHSFHVTGCKKPFTNKDGSPGEECRYVTSQPLKLTENQYNLRKLEELPRQLILADMPAEFEECVVMNLDWHLAKLRALSYRDLIEDIEFGLERVTRDYNVTEWSLMRDALRLSEEALTYKAQLLPSQILGRVSKVGIRALVWNCYV